MTLQELCGKYGVKESYVKNNFKQFHDGLLKKLNIDIIKTGRGEKAQYFQSIKLKDEEERALTLYEQPDCRIGLSDDTFGLVNWPFLIFAVVAAKNSCVYRGSYIDFLKYVDCPVTERNIEHLKDGLRELVERKIIYLVDDKSTDEGYFGAILCRDKEIKLNFEIRMIKKCREIAELYNKRSWIPLLKTWLGIAALKPYEPYTVEELMELTGLTQAQIMDSKRMLKSENLIEVSRVYVNSKCIGSQSFINGFDEDNRALTDGMGKRGSI